MSSEELLTHAMQSGDLSLLRLYREVILLSVHYP
jgi:hypothetical protein